MGERASGARAGAKRPLLARLRALFGGTARAPARPQDAKPASQARAAQEDAPAVAPLSRMTVAQWLWGDGFLRPGDAEYVLDLVKPLGLTPAMSMLDLTAGLGGGARVIAQAYGTYITGLERSAETAKRGIEMSAASNLGKKVTIAHYNPETVELRPNSFDCVLGRGATYAVVEKERLLRVVHQGMKQRSQLLLTEFTGEPALADRPELAAWKAKETFPPRLWTLEQYTDLLVSLGFDIRVTKDITDIYRTMIVSGWARMLKEIDLKGMAKQHALTVIDEAELWTKRIAALECGALHLFRIYALLNKPSK